MAGPSSEYVEGGGFLFAMCSATDTIDIALAWLATDIVPEPFDNTPYDPNYRGQVDYTQTFAFQDFKLMTNPMVYEFSDLDTSNYAMMRGAMADYFTLFAFAAKYDPVPAMLTQNHVNVINGFLGQTTGYGRQHLKRSVTVLAAVEGTEEVKYIHGKRGYGHLDFPGRARSRRLPAPGGGSADGSGSLPDLAGVPADPQQHSVSGGAEKAPEDLIRIFLQLRLSCAMA